MIALRDDVEGFLVARRNERAARLTLVKELVLGDLVGLRVMRDKDDFHVAITGRDELVKQEEEAAREVLLHRVHRARSVHDADHRCVRFLADVSLEMLVAQVVLMEREATLFLTVECLGRFETLRFTPMLRCQNPFDALTRSAPFVETNADADVAITLALGKAIGRNLAKSTTLQVRQFEILEHDLDQFVERDVGLVVIDAGAIASLALALALTVFARFADYLSRLRIAVTL